MIQNQHSIGSRDCFLNYRHPGPRRMCYAAVIKLINNNQPSLTHWSGNRDILKDGDDGPDEDDDAEESDSAPDDDADDE